MTSLNSLSKDAIRRAFDRAKDTYAKAATVQAEAARDCALRIPKGDYPRIIEIGAGSGLLTRHMVERCAHEQYTAVDISPLMLAQVDKQILSSPRLIAADGERLDLPQESCDLLASSSTMQWYHAPEASIPDNLRLLRPGGFFSLSIYVEGTYTEFAAASEASGFGTMLPMRPADTYIDIVRKTSPAVLHSNVIPRTAHYPTVSALIRAHRATGATATPGGKHPSKEAYKRFIEYLETHFRTPEGVRSTAVILELWGKR